MDGRDDLEGPSEMPSTYSRGYIEVYVQNPVTHHTWDQGKFTTYEIYLETNNRAFSVLKSSVRRRYSEFVWLRNILLSHFPDIKCPPLPPKRYFGGQFHPEVIESRTVGLSDFTQKILDEPVYLSENALHLFLQTQLTIQAIEDCIQGKTEKGVVETIMDQLHLQKSMAISIEDTEYFSQQPGSINSSVASSPHDIFSPTRPHSMEFNSSSESGSYCSQHSSQPISEQGSGSQPSSQPNSEQESGSFEPPLNGQKNGSLEASESSTLKQGRFMRVQSMPQMVGLLSSPTASARVSRSFSKSSLRSNSSSDLGSLDLRRKRHVTFSPEVTVAEVIDRFSRSPRNVKREDMPSVIIAQTMAY